MADTTEKKRVYGIDLGTTYSAIAFINDDGKPEIIPNSDNERITPSVVFFEEPSEEGKVGNVVVGKIAKESAKTDPARVISFVKQEMGTGWTKELDGITLNPEKVSSYILTRLAGDAKTCAGHDVKDVIITCPAYFGDAERKATKAAGEIAGLNVLQIIDEPVAAAMHYGLNKAEGDRTAIVYDLGGGTFDVTVVSIKGGEVSVVCSDGNHRLGGKNWDERVVEYFASKFAEASGTDKDAVMGDADTLYDLQLQAEIAKQTLTTRASAKVKVAFDGNSERIEITREAFDEMTKDLLDQTVDLTQKMFDLAATKGVAKINDFLLVGGSTRMPQVMAMVKEKFASMVDNEPSSFEVDEAVAKGAATFGLVKAIQAKVEEKKKEILEKQEAEGGKPASEEDKKNAQEQAIKDVADDIALPVETVGNMNDVVATTVASRSYGIRVLKAGSPVVYNMIVKQDKVPVSFEREFPVSEDNAEKLPLQVFANNVLEKVASLDDSVTVGDAVMMLPPGLPKGAMIRIKFTLTEEGVLSLDATDVTHGTPVHAEFEAKDGLSKEEIEAARKETADLVIE